MFYLFYQNQKQRQFINKQEVTSFPDLYFPNQVTVFYALHIEVTIFFFFHYIEDLIEKVFRLCTKGLITFRYFSTITSEQTNITEPERTPLRYSQQDLTTQPKIAAAHQHSLGYSATNPYNGPFNNYPKPPSPPHSTEQFKFILRSSSMSPSRNTFPLGIVVGRFMPSLPYHIDRVSGIFHSNIISSFGTQLSFDDHATSLTDFPSQVRVLFKMLDNILSLLNSSKQDIISISFFIVDAEKYTSSFLKELHHYLPTDQISVSLVGVNFLLPPHSKVQAKTKILTRSAILSNFEVQKI